MLTLELSSDFFLKFLMMVIQHSVNSDLLFNTQSRVPQADWFVLEINEKAALNINKLYWYLCFVSRNGAASLDRLRSC